MTRTMVALLVVILSAGCAEDEICGDCAHACPGQGCVSRCVYSPPDQPPTLEATTWCCWDAGCIFHPTEDWSAYTCESPGAQTCIYGLDGYVWDKVATCNYDLTVSYETCSGLRCRQSLTLCHGSTACCRT